MAEAAARREARRRRILENSENRLQKITGKYQDKSVEESNSDLNYLKTQTENGCIKNKCNTTTGTKTILTETYETTFGQDNDGSQIFKLSDINSEYTQVDDLGNHLDGSYLLKGKETECNTVNSFSKLNLSNQTLCEQVHISFLSSLLFSPLSYICFAAFLNILLITNVDYSFYKGIITPYVVISTTRLCLLKEFGESQENSMLMAALILCNIKPTVVHNFNKIWTVCRSIFKDFALYLTSFVLLNWIISFCWTDFNYVQFY